MTWPEWIPAFSTSGVLAAVAVVAAPFYKASIEKGIQHGFDQSLETFKAERRADEERLKAELRARGDEVAALRSSILSGAAARHAALDKRRIEAVERIWSEAVELARFRTATQMVSLLNTDLLMEEASKAGSGAKKIQDFADTLLKGFGFHSFPEDIRTSNAPDKERPFLDPVAWALFSTYRQAVMFPVILLALIRTGAPKGTVGKREVILDPIRKALPEYEAYIDQVGLNGLDFLVTTIEDRLLATLSQNLTGTTADEAALKRAHEILVAVERTTKETTAVALAPEVAGLAEGSPLPNR